ncbi:AI-2E family transporter [archaeon]|nr:AI-2E family transporter [archaeon]
MRELLKNKKLVSFVIIAILSLFLIYASLMFLNAFLGALVVFVMARPFYSWLKTKKIAKPIAAWIIIVLSLLILIIPLFFLVHGLIDQTATIPQTIRNFDTFLTTIEEYVPFDIDLNEDKVIQQTVSFFEQILSPIFSNLFGTLANIILFYFLLYYMLIHDKKFIERIKRLLPFTEKNKSKVINKFGEITKSTIIGSLLIAIVQGGMLAVGFHFLGIHGALFWGFVTAILSFIPIIGSPIIWGPACVFFLSTGDITRAVILFIWGFLITLVDNFIRPITNKKYGRIHPLVSVIGVFIGLVQFGFIGIFIGPLLVAYVILFWEIYKEEYLE